MTTQPQLLLIAAVTLAGCAGTAPLTTSSGNPEYLLRGATQQQAVERIAAGCVTQGKIVESQTANMVTCSKPMTDVVMQALVGTGQIKHQYIATKQGSDIRVMMSGAWIEATNGFGAIQRHSVDLRKGKTAQAAQEGLNKMLSAGE